MHVDAIDPPSAVAPLSVCPVSRLVPVTQVESVVISVALAQLLLACANTAAVKKMEIKKKTRLLMAGLITKLVLIKDIGRLR